MTAAPGLPAARMTAGLRRPPRWLPWIVAAAAFAVRAVRLDSPPIYVFDEVYYVGDAASLLRSGVERGLAAHPPLGKWLIGAGIWALGLNPTGWRIAAALAGAAVCAVASLIAWHWTARLDLALLGGLLCGVDGILFTSSRVAMLDIFEALFVVLFAHAVTLAVLSARAGAGAGAGPGSGVAGDRGRVPGRRWLVLAAAWIGLGAAVKWSALYCVPVLVGAIIWRAKTGASRQTALPSAAPWPPPLSAELGPPPAWSAPSIPPASAAWWVARALWGTIGAGALVVGGYLLAFVPTWATNPALASPSAFLSRQRAVLRFQLRLSPLNTYAQPAIDWLAQRHPTGLLLQLCQAGRATASGVCPDRAEASTVAIVSLANPVGWIGGMAALAVLVARLVYVREAPVVLALALIVARWAPWLFTRDGYSFYAAPLVPFVVLGLVLALSLAPRRAIRPAAAALGIAAVVAFAFFYPYWAGVPMSGEALRLRHWLSTWP
ncbi:MAG: phospholipid carrier-dependent glycosyltransferase [Frankiaceae bacterium]|jgi:dolichyl-phosphate-mannose--protein O-mannosyl transferase|nr:phospholipid carrier-dependent glycosyltransferase [Frankiaceae bacterium]